MSQFENSSYIKVLPCNFWWCNTHQRRATHYKILERLGRIIDVSETPQCDPRLGGIMISCRSVNLTGICDIKEEP